MNMGLVTIINTCHDSTPNSTMKILRRGYVSLMKQCPRSGPGLALVCPWSGPGLALVCPWSGTGLALVWHWSGPGLALVWLVFSSDSPVGGRIALLFPFPSTKPELFSPSGPYGN